MLQALITTRKSRHQLEAQRCFAPMRRGCSWWNWGRVPSFELPLIERWQRQRESGVRSLCKDNQGEVDQLLQRTLHDSRCQ